MIIREPLDADYERIRGFLATGWGGEWDVARTEARLAAPGVHRFITDGAYCHVTANMLNDPPGTMPAGPCTLIATLSPLRPQKRMTRAQYETWALDTLQPLVTETLRVFAADNPKLLDKPCYSIGARTLVPFWEALFNANVEPYGDKTYVIWLSELQTVLGRL